MVLGTNSGSSGRADNVNCFSSPFLFLSVCVYMAGEGVGVAENLTSQGLQGVGTMNYSSRYALVLPGGPLSYLQK